LRLWNIDMRVNNRTNPYAPTRGQMAAVLCVVLAIIMITLAAAFIWLYKPNHHEPVLPFSTDTVQNPSQSTAVPVESGNEKVPDVPIYTAREEVYNFLLIGHDRAARLADVVMLVNYDIHADRVSVMQIPRDTYIGAGSNVPKINVLYAAYYNHAAADGEKNPTKVAAEKLAETLEQNLCIQLQYTAVMDLDGFADIVNAVGGVDVEIPSDMDYDDPVQDLHIHLKAGMTHLDGAAAEGFVRFREGFVQADIGRTNAQKIFLAAFINKVKSSVSITNIPVLTSLANEVVSNLTTDITAADVVYFGKNALSVDLSNITLLTVPGDSVKSGGSWYYVINRADTLKAVNAYFNIYDNDITDAIFDKKRIFCDEDADTISAAYNAEKSALENEFKADEVLKDSIDIPHT